MRSVSISNGNSKMGGIPSVSLPSITTCRPCECREKCYARKLERLRPSVRNAYKRNLDILNSDPNTFWREVEASIMLSRFFRFHVSGDIPNFHYLQNMILIAERNPHCQILCFTKKYEMVNKWCAEHEVLPFNLHIIFSAWDNLKMENPYYFPSAYVRYKDGHTDAPDDAYICYGNCSECIMTDGGCWALKKGESVVFDEH